MLKAPVHEVERAAFPAVDVHNHVNDARNRVFARQPGTTFIALHVANHPEDLDDAPAVLDLYPNVVVETGQGRWKISGLDLPKDVLEKVYAKNAERVIPASAGAGDRR
jgi:hypothetical protein